MAGKTKKGAWGGIRPGSGRKRQVISQRHINKIIRSLNKLKKELGVEITDVLANMSFGRLPVEKDGEIVFLRDKNLSPTAMQSAAKALLDYLIVKESHQEMEVTKPKGPAIRLPPTKPDPAKVIPMEEKKRNAV